MIVSQFLRYIEVERHYSPRTVSEYGADLRSFVSSLGLTEETFDPCLVDETDVKQWMMSMLDAGQTARSVKRRLSALRSFYKYLLRQEIVTRDVTSKVMSPKMDKPLPVFFRDAEVEREQALGEQTLEALLHPIEGEAQPKEVLAVVRDNLIISLLYQTGMRRAELVGLADGDVDLREGQIRVFGKRRKERIIPIGKDLISRLNDYLSVRHGFETADNHLLVWVGRDGVSRPMTAAQVYKVVCDRMGEVSTLKKHSPHVLRHTFATTMLNNGADIRTIQTLMGHASLAATQVYTHTTFEQIKQTYLQAHPRSKKKF